MQNYIHTHSLSEPLNEYLRNTPNSFGELYTSSYNCDTFKTLEMKWTFAFGLFLIVGTYGTRAQVGIGTTSPTAQLEINVPTGSLPALELAPQATPTGTAMGQLAVIGDKLFMYDAARAKWLSTESSALQFNRESAADNEILRFGGDLRSEESGPVMPFDGTIVYAAGRSHSGPVDKQFQIRLNDTPVTTLTYTAREVISTNLNIDFNAGDYLTMYVNLPGAPVEKTAFVVWVKWRS